MKPSFISPTFAEYSIWINSKKIDNQTIDDLISILSIDEPLSRSTLQKRCPKIYRTIPLTGRLMAYFGSYNRPWWKKKYLLPIIPSIISTLGKEASYIKASNHADAIEIRWDILQKIHALANCVSIGSRDEFDIAYDIFFDTSYQPDQRAMAKEYLLFSMARMLDSGIFAPSELPKVHEIFSKIIAKGSSAAQMSELPQTDIVNKLKKKLELKLLEYSQLHLKY
jgi:hypothetical protein